MYETIASEMTCSERDARAGIDSLSNSVAVIRAAWGVDGAMYSV